MSDSTGTVARAELIPTLNVSISINDIKVQFNGSPDSVLSSVISVYIQTNSRYRNCKEGDA